MKHYKRKLYALLSAMLIFASTLGVVQASENQPVPMDWQSTAQGENGESAQDVILVNPLYQDFIEDKSVLDEINTTWGTAEGITVYAAVPQFDTADSATGYIREQLVQRSERISLQIPAKLYSKEILSQIFYDAMEYSDSCSGQEGDALALVWRKMNTSTQKVGDWYSITYSVIYFTTLEQEQELTSAVDQAMNSLALSGKTEYEKVKAIHDYICDHVDYDYNYSKYSAYDALCTGSAVCQGYAVLFYRMCKEAGLSVRAVTGIGNGGRHAWNIVKLGEYYYNVDCTWDGQWTETYNTYLLKSQGDFGDHVRDEEYLTTSFYTAFPMSPISWRDESASGYDLDNLSQTYTTIDGNTVSSTASGKPKLLIFFKTTCGNSQATIEDICDSEIKGADIIAVEINYNTRDDVAAFKSKYASDLVTFSYSTGSTNNGYLWSYIRKANFGDGNSVILPVLFYIDKDNKLQYASSGYCGADTIRANLAYYCKATMLSMAEDSIRMSAGESYSLNVMLNGEKQTAFLWTSSNEAVAKVDGNGKVTALGQGEAVITAAAKDGSGEKASCKVTVTGTDDSTPTETPVPTATPEPSPDPQPTETPEPSPDPQPTEIPVPEERTDGWHTIDGREYWYENGVRQGYDPENPDYRGKEIYDPDTDAWFWLDNVQQGAKAVSKDVYQDSSAGIWAANEDGTGKWVRYDENGYMIKGWSADHRYYFDVTYGTMAKGFVVIEGTEYYFNVYTGVLEDELGSVPEGQGWKSVDGKDYWYEDGVRQGYAPQNPNYRGKEIYDGGSDAWYWLDNVQQGAKAVSKDVYQESLSAYPDREDGTGKWVRYDADGHMVKGWQETEDGTYYFEKVTGAMAKGTVIIDGEEYTFDEVTGKLQ